VGYCLYSELNSLKQKSSIKEEKFNFDCLLDFFIPYNANPLKKASVNAGKGVLFDIK
jgi:hypothetical protein